MIVGPDREPGLGDPDVLMIGEVCVSHPGNPPEQGFALVLAETSRRCAGHVF
jgi:hypothetical protein